MMMSEDISQFVNCLHRWFRFWVFTLLKHEQSVQSRCIFFFSLQVAHRFWDWETSFLQTSNDNLPLEKAPIATRLCQMLFRRFSAFHYRRQRNRNDTVCLQALSGHLSLEDGFDWVVGNELKWVYANFAPNHVRGLNVSLKFPIRKWKFASLLS